jgi:hypothetical protein
MLYIVELKPVVNEKILSSLTFDPGSLGQMMDA